MDNTPMNETIAAASEWLVGVGFNKLKTPEEMEKSLLLTRDPTSILRRLKIMQAELIDGTNVQYPSTFYTYALERYEQLQRYYESLRIQPPYHPSIRDTALIQLLLEANPTHILIGPTGRFLDDRVRDTWDAYNYRLEKTSVALQFAKRQLLYGNLLWKERGGDPPPLPIGVHGPAPPPLNANNSQQRGGGRGRRRGRGGGPSNPNYHMLDSGSESSSVSFSPGNEEESSSSSSNKGNNTTDTSDDPAYNEAHRNYLGAQSRHTDIKNQMSTETAELQLLDKQYNITVENISICAKNITNRKGEIKRIKKNIENEKASIEKAKTKGGKLEIVKLTKKGKKSEDEIVLENLQELLEEAEEDLNDQEKKKTDYETRKIQLDERRQEKRLFLAELKPKKNAALSQEKNLKDYLETLRSKVTRMSGADRSLANRQGLLNDLERSPEAAREALARLREQNRGNDVGENSSDDEEREERRRRSRRESRPNELLHPIPVYDNLQAFKVREFTKTHPEPLSCLLTAINSIIELQGQLKVQQDLTRNYFESMSGVPGESENEDGNDPMILEEGETQMVIPKTQFPKTQSYHSPNSNDNDEESEMTEYARKIMNNYRNVILNGEPGTGKSTVAKIYKNMQFGIGIDCILLPDEAGVASDFVGAYEGQTQLKAKQEMDNSIGTTKFYDETYLLVEKKPDGTISSSYGYEALTVILFALSEPMGLRTVIFAGYADRMQNLISVNEGMKRRFTKRFLMQSVRLVDLEERFMSIYDKIKFEDWFPNITRSLFQKHTHTILEQLYRPSAKNNNKNFIQSQNYVTSEKFGDILIGNIRYYNSVYSNDNTKKEKLKKLYEQKRIRNLQAMKTKLAADQTLSNEEKYLFYQEYESEYKIFTLDKDTDVFLDMKQAYIASWTEFLNEITNYILPIDFDDDDFISDEERFAPIKQQLRAQREEARRGLNQQTEGF